MNKNKRKSISYAKWGYFFIAPFFVIYITTQLYPLLATFYNSFFKSYRDGLTIVGPDFIGLDNYVKLFTPSADGTINILTYTGNTLIMWVMGAIPQLIVALLLALWFTSTRLKIKAQSFFKTVIYMPNLIMASAFAMLIFTLFDNVGPINTLFMEWTGASEPINFFTQVWTVRGLVAMINYLMWFGNTTILFMAGIMGIDQSLFESAAIDGAKSNQVFFKVTLPLLMPILVYVVITALIGGLQMFDVPQILTNRLGTPDRTSMTLVMYLNSYLTPSKNFGMGGAISVVMFIVTGVMSFFIYKFTVKSDKK